MWYFENNEVFNRCLKLLMPTLVISQGHLPVPRAHPMVASLRNIGLPHLHQKVTTDKATSRISSHWHWLMYLNILLHDLHLDIQSGGMWHLLTHLRFGEKTESWHLWWVMYLLQTLLSDNQDSIYLTFHGHCWFICGQVKGVVLATCTSGAFPHSACQCGQEQTVNHVVDSCPLTNLNGVHCLFVRRMMMWSNIWTVQQLQSSCVLEQPVRGIQKEIWGHYAALPDSTQYWEPLRVIAINPYRATGVSIYNYSAHKII